jgi:hypothetical protein
MDPPLSERYMHSILARGDFVIKKERFDRRQFLQSSAAMLGTGALLPPGAAAQAPPATGKVEPSDRALRMRLRVKPEQSVWIVLEADAGSQERLASRELARGLRKLGFVRDPIVAAAGEASAGPHAILFKLSVNKGAFKHPDAYEITWIPQTTKSSEIRISAATPQAVLYAVFDFLERQGTYFGLDGEIYPLDPVAEINLPPAREPWRGEPRFGVRGLVPWPDFLNCITVFNREDLRAYLEAMLRMRFNTLGIHVYSGINQWTESFLSFEYGGVGHLAFTDTTATHRWGYLPQRTSRYGMGSADFYDSEVFGSEATTRARSCFEAAELAQQLWRESFEYAAKLGIRTGVGFEPYLIPDEIFRAIPPEARAAQVGDKPPRARVDVDSVAAKDILESRLAQLLETYPTVDYVWLWEDEGMSWDSQKSGVPLSTTPFIQAHDFLRRHAPKKRLVISGWGGVVRHFADFHRRLPEDIIFSSLSDQLGWDPVSEEFSKLEGRERWPIPWLEDDPAMWLPQFHVDRFVTDMDRAGQFGCQGLMGIHWRHRIMDINAGFQSRYSWEAPYSAPKHFQAYAQALVREPAAKKVAEILTDTDRNRRILCTFTGEVKDGHAQTHEYTGDYNEAFNYWNGYEPEKETKESQKKIAEALRALTAPAGTAEGERLNHITRHVEMLVPYSEAWSTAFALHKVLEKAGALKKDGKKDEARDLVLHEGVPLWLKLAPLVRDTFVAVQDYVSTRNDLGTLASMHNKYERLALFRLRASMKEYLGELPTEVEKLYRQVREPITSLAPRVFIPTRPTLLHKGESVRISAIAVGPTLQVGRVQLMTRLAGSGQWSSTAMKNVGRRTYQAEIKAPSRGPDFLDYFVEVEAHGTGLSPRKDGRGLTAPNEAPKYFYSITLA